MSGREEKRVRVLSLGDEGGRSDLADLTPGERMDLIWQLAVDAWTFKAVGRLRDLADVEELKRLRPE